VGIARSDDTALVQAARRGDRAAFANLHAQFAPMVHGIALARMPVSYANDLVQETFLQALDRLPLLRDDTAFGPWLATIARNLAVEFHRRRRARAHEALSSDLAQPAQSLSGAQAERACQLLAAIRTLPDSYSETLVLRLVEGMTGPQIAASTGLTHGSVRVNLTRGMGMLRDRLQEMNLCPEASP
jgi:RNA polymerase sigma-70 factor (ECF subfamily)